MDGERGGLSAAMRRYFRIGLALWALGLGAAAIARQTENVVLIVSDGLRWQEIFSGADAALLNEKEGGSWLPEKELRQRYWREDPAARRALLFPFLWGTVARQGQMFGNQVKGSVARVTNGKAYSYPGYNEMATGYPNDAIDSNEFGPNPNATVFEWLNGQDMYRGHVAIFGTWIRFEDIFNKNRSHLVMQTGWNLPAKDPHEEPREALLRELFASTTRRAYCSSATGRRTTGPMPAAMTWCSTVRSDSINSSGSFGRRCRRCRSTAARRPLSLQPIMVAATRPLNGRSTASRRRARRTSGSRS